MIDTSYARRRFVRQAYASPILHFDIGEFGIPKDQFLTEFSLNPDELDFDRYDVLYSTERIVRDKYPDQFKLYEEEWLESWMQLAKKEGNIAGFWFERIKCEVLNVTLIKLRPKRRRSCYEYIVSRKGANGNWEIVENGVPIFKQPVRDKRSRTRIFSAPKREIYKNPLLFQLIGNICEVVTHQPTIPESRFKVTMHQMITYAFETSSSPAPEGLHQDGSPFIVSALVIDKVNVMGGESMIYYTKNKNIPEFKSTLNPGEGILQSDMQHNYWHEITQINRLDPKKVGYRSIIGFDIDPF